MSGYNMKNNTSYIFAIILAIIISLVIGCDNAKTEKELVEDVTEVYEIAINNHQSYLKAQDSLVASVKEWEEEHKIFVDEYQPADSLEKEHKMLEKNHDQLVSRHKQFIEEHEMLVQKIDEMKSMVGVETEKVKGRIQDMFSQIEEYLARHKKMMKEHKQIEKKHEDYLYGQRVDLH
jgi:chromosome segregation ATPase